jgi:hypothetical protein
MPTDSAMRQIVDRGADLRAEAGALDAEPEQPSPARRRRRSGSCDRSGSSRNPKSIWPLSTAGGWIGCASGPQKYLAAATDMNTRPMVIST